MVDIEKRLDKAHQAAKDQIKKIIGDLSAIEIKTGELKADVGKLGSIEVSEKNTLKRVIESLTLLKSKINSHHQEINKVIVLLEFVKEKVNDERITAGVLSEFNEAVAEEHQLGEDLLVNNVNQSCADLSTILKTGFSIELAVSHDLKVIQQLLNDIQSKVEKI